MSTPIDKEVRYSPRPWPCGWLASAWRLDSFCPIQKITPLKESEKWLKASEIKATLLIKRATINLPINKDKFIDIDHKVIRLMR